ncbi:hypothetical protein GGR58DRAFT_488093 [Xylaria digitata]|nr:hypothetical protein GGR58DRAFT_488093 [Xylaria digitata]
MLIGTTSIEGLGDLVVANINDLVTGRLHEKYLCPFISSRDKTLRPERSNGSEAIRLLRR